MYGAQWHHRSFKVGDQVSELQPRSMCILMSEIKLNTHTHIMYIHLHSGMYANLASTHTYIRALICKYIHFVWSDCSIVSLLLVIPCSRICELFLLKGCLVRLLHAWLNYGQIMGGNERSGDGDRFVLSLVVRRTSSLTSFPTNGVASCNLLHAS